MVKNKYAEHCACEDDPHNDCEHNILGNCNDMERAWQEGHDAAVRAITHGLQLPAGASLRREGDSEWVRIIEAEDKDG